jgi:cephalosporin hydroxylase
VVFDSVMTMVHDAPNAGQGWAQDNPLEAVKEFLAGDEDFEVDPEFNRLGVTYCQSGFLRRRETEH